MSATDQQKRSEETNANMSTTGQSEDIQEKEAENRELRALRSHNPPGMVETASTTSGGRAKIPTIANAKSKFDILKKNMEERLDHLEDPARASLTDPQVRGKILEHQQQRSGAP